MASTLIYWLNLCIGTYTPITYTITDAEGVTSAIIPAGVAGVDWSYVGSILIICVSIYSVLRLCGAVLSRSI